MTGPLEHPLQSVEHITSNESIDINACLSEAEALKTAGNDYFRSSQWNHALEAYRSGLGQLPKRVVCSSSTLDGPSGGSSEEQKNEQTKQHEAHGSASSDPRCAKARAVLNANIGACYVKLGDHKMAIEACSEALLDDSHYVKALQRRASSNEIMNTWSSLNAAQEDYNALLTILPSSSPLIGETERLLGRLKPRVEAAQKQETAEMLDKLKGLGNSILGNFGLSTDNFKFEPNGQGGYSMNFTR